MYIYRYNYVLYYQQLVLISKFGGARDNGEMALQWPPFCSAQIEVISITAKLLFHQSPTRHSDYQCDDVVTVLSPQHRD